MRTNSCNLSYTVKNFHIRIREIIDNKNIETCLLQFSLPVAPALSD